MGKAGPAWKKPGEHPDPAHALSSFAKSLLLLFLPQDAAGCGWLCSEKSKEGLKNQPQSKILLPFPSSQEQQCHSPPWMSPWAPALSLCCSKHRSMGLFPVGRALPASKGPWVKWYQRQEVVRNVFVGLLRRVQLRFACGIDCGLTTGTFRDSS